MTLWNIEVETPAVTALEGIGPYFFIDLAGNVVTVKSEHYLKILNDNFPHSFRKKIGHYYFQQDGATCHITSFNCCSKE